MNYTSCKSDCTFLLIHWYHHKRDCDNTREEHAHQKEVHYMSKNLKSFCESAVFFIYALLIAYILCININAQHIWCCRAGFCCAVALLLGHIHFPASMKKLKMRIHVMLGNNKLLLLSIFVGLILRTIPILCHYTWILEDNQGDCAIHFFGAQQLAYDGFFTDMNARYEATFIQLFSYTKTLSWFVRIFKDITTAIVVTNVLFDTISVVFISMFLHSVNGNMKQGIILWSLNPFFIVMCWLPMAVTVVNTILVVSLSLGGWLLMANKKQEQPYGYAILFGLSIFLGNLFRPLFSVLLIAEVISLLIQILSNPQKVKRTIAVILIIVILAILPGKIYDRQLTTIGGYDVPKNKAGWNFFVGANFESKGKWSSEDNYYFWCELLPETDIDDAENVMFEAGIQRYKAMTPTQFLTHLHNKLTVLLADVGNAIYDIVFAFQSSESTVRFWIFLRNYGTGYFLLLTAGIFMRLLRKVKTHHLPEVTFLPALTFIGLVMAYTLVEVMNRYSSMLVALLIVIVCMLPSDHTVSLYTDA